jgi:hypothetical protein
VFLLPFDAILPLQFAMGHRVDAVFLEEKDSIWGPESKEIVEIGLFLY